MRSYSVAPLRNGSPHSSRPPAPTLARLRRHSVSSGVDRQTAAIAMTAIHSYATVDRAAEPLYEPAAVRSVLADSYSAATPTPSEGHGLRLIEKWAQTANGPAIESAVPTR